MPTDKKFTGQRLDDTGLYYYGARYYDPEIGRFISADTFVPWSTGVDVVSYPLTVNAIPTGLGSANAPQGNYPRFTMQAAVNPQNLNRYSYVLNNPLAYNDPFGWWTFGIGININIGIGPGFTISGMFVWDLLGGRGIAWSPGGGGYGGAGGSITLQIQATTADRIEQLRGFSSVTGGSGTVGPTTLATFGLFNLGLTSGGEYVLAKGYQGINLNPIGLGLSIPAPLEMHSFVEDAKLIVLRPSTTTSSGNINPVAYAPPVPVDVGGGFRLWGVTSEGVPVISLRDPSNYSPEDWM